MFRTIIFFALFSLAQANAQEQPNGYSLERYAVIWQKSLFTNKEADKAKDPNSQLSTPNSQLYSSSWILAGVYRYPGGRGAMIVNRASGIVEEILTNEKNASGLSLVEVRENGASGSTSVKVDQGGKVFWVSNKR